MSDVAANRWVGLDALRGAAIAAMILVNNPGAWGSKYQYAPLRHAEWHGCTFADLVFPTFLFCVGVAIVPALGARIAAGVPRGPLTTRILVRTATLVLLGLYLAAFPFVSSHADEAWLAPVLDVRFPGVLQRIGVCYGLAALLFVFTPVLVQRVVTVACLVGYWLLLTLPSVPGFGAPDLGTPEGTLPAYVDRLVFGSHVWVPGKYDPEGLLSTIPALATCLLGVEAGRALASARDARTTLRNLLAGGAALMALGYAWSFVLPFNKPLWTSSYAAWTAGIATVLLALAWWAFDVRGRRALAHPLQVYGVNALLAFVGSGLAARFVGRLVTVSAGGKEVPVKDWFFQKFVLWIFEEPQLASLAFAMGWVLVWYAVLAVLFRRAFIWKV